MSFSNKIAHKKLHFPGEAGVLYHCILRGKSVFVKQRFMFHHPLVTESALKESALEHKTVIIEGTFTGDDVHSTASGLLQPRGQKPQLCIRGR